MFIRVYNENSKQEETVKMYICVEEKHKKVVKFRAGQRKYVQTRQLPFSPRRIIPLCPDPIRKVPKCYIPPIKGSRLANGKSVLEPELIMILQRFPAPKLSSKGVFLLLHGQRQAEVRGAGLYFGLTAKCGVFHTLPVFQLCKVQDYGELKFCTNAA